jgi:hypothetical protein
MSPTTRSEWSSAIAESVAGAISYPADTCDARMTGI